MIVQLTILKFIIKYASWSKPLPVFSRLFCLECVHKVEKLAFALVWVYVEFKPISAGRTFIHSDWGILRRSMKLPLLRSYRLWFSSVYCFMMILRHLGWSWSVQFLFGKMGWARKFSFEVEYLNVILSTKKCIFYLCIHEIS